MDRVAGLDPETKVNLGKARILLLYDNARALDILAATLRSFGARNVKRCSSVDEARVLMERQQIDLVIADVDLPVTDGFDFVHWLRRSGIEDNAFTPVVIVTGHTQISKVKTARDCGANFIVAKPVTPAVLLERIVWVAQDPRAFVEVGSYVGPDRRHKTQSPPATLGERRAEQKAEKVA